MPTLAVRHVTRYRYNRPVSLGEHRMMFRPRESYDQRLLESRLVITPEPSKLRYVQDVFGNCVGIAQFDRPARELVFKSMVRLEHSPAPLVADPDDLIDPNGSTFPMAYSAEDMPDLLRSVERQYADPDGVLGRWARQFLRPGGPTGVLDLLAEMTRTIHRDFTYASRLEAGTQAPLDTLRVGSGSCRDFAMLMMEAVRSLGLAARFVSGYIYSRASERDDEAHASHARKGGGHTHAWARVYMPSCGWVEFDPTNGIVGNTDLVRVAIVRDPRQAVPLSGTWMGEASDYLGMTVEVDVRVEPDQNRVRRAA